MNAQSRPGGLTALAVINFIFAGFGLLALLAFAAVFAVFGAALESVPEGQRALAEALKQVGVMWFILSLVASLISAILLLVSGIGYLKLSKFMGRTLGNVYGIFALIGTFLTALLMPPELGGSFTIGTLIGLIYPVLTLILLNTTFKEDFVN